MSGSTDKAGKDALLAQAREQFDRAVPPYAGLGRECCPWCGATDHGPEHECPHLPEYDERDAHGW